MNNGTDVSHLRILLVEDHPFQLIGLQMHLNRLGFFHLTPALDQAEALAWVAQGRCFDLLLCDQYLSDGTGLALIEKIHRLGAIRHAILISGLECPQILRKILRIAQRRQLPLRACLMKPLSGQALFNALESLDLHSDSD